MKLLTLSDLKHFWANVAQKIPIKISDLQDDVDMLTSHEDLHLENLPNESPNIIFENNTPSYTWREMPHGDLIDWSYYGDPYNKELTFLTSSSKITYKNNSNSQNTCELAFGQSKVETKTILKMNYYYGSNDTNKPDDDSNYVSSSLVFTLNPGYNNLASSSFDETEYSYSDVSPDSDNYYLGKKNPFKEIYAKDFKFVYGENDFSLMSTFEEIAGLIEPHLEDTDIHVTTADKTKWNNGVSQSYVLRYSSSSVTDNSTIAYSTLDNTDNIKSGDKVIDVDGKIFSIVSVDTANQTVTVGSALIDLALDANVVHTRGNETVSGQKIFANRPIIFNSNATVQADVPNLMFKNSLVERASTTLEGEQTILFTDKNASNIASIQAKTSTSGVSDIILTSYSEYNGVKTTGIVIRRTPTTSKFHGYSDNVTSLGDTNRRWSKVYAMSYYYGNDNIEFSTKFVTTDTAQTITGAKTFSGNINVYNSDSTTDTANIVLKNSKAERGSTTDIGEQNISFVDKNNNQLGNIKCINNSSGVTNMYITCNASGNDVGVRLSRSPSTTYFRSTINNDCKLGTADVRWSDVQTYKVNGLEPSSLGMPANKADSIDISSYFTQMGSGDTNAYDVSVNGYIYLQLTNIITVHCFAVEAPSPVATYIQTFSRGNDGQLYVLFPVRKNDTFKSVWYTGSTVTVNKAMFIPCQGNV